MAEPLVPDDLWAAVEPLLPPGRPRPRGGRPRVPDRAALTGIVFVLVSGTAWEHLPAEMREHTLDCRVTKHRRSDSPAGALQRMPGQVWKEFGR